MIAGPWLFCETLAAVHRGMDAAIDDGLAIDEAAFARIVPTRDANEGVAAFLEKRRPESLGRNTRLAYSATPLSPDGRREAGHRVVVPLAAKHKIERLLRA
jgi:hypothetical protein